MQRDPRAWVADALAACRAVLEFSRGETLESYRDRPMLRSAVERQLEILGEALSQLAKATPELAARIPDLRRIVDFRNVLAHSYAIVDDAIVWAAVEHNVPALLTTLEQIARELDGGDLH
jgi:uncharacterized protein with HEPN domain